MSSTAVQPPPVWDLSPGRYAEYVYLDTPITYNPVSMLIGCSEPRVPIGTPWTGTSRFRMENCAGYLQMRPCTMRLNGYTGQPTNRKLGGLYNGIARVRGLPPYYAEVGGPNSFSDPGQPICTVRPVAGESFDVPIIDKVYSPDGSYVVSAFLCRYKTLATNADWGGKSGCTITLLMERADQPGQPGCIGYMYVFWNGHLIDSMAAIYQPDGSIQGRQFYGVEFST